MKTKFNLLFLCTGNSCRSQMAEGWTRTLKSDVITVYSAGTQPQELDPRAVAVMAEAGVDISHHQSKHVNAFKDVDLDAVVTVCGHAHETCPYFPPRCKVVHVGFDDPPKMAKMLAEKGATASEQLDCYRKIRDEIKAYVEDLPGSLAD